MTELINNSYIHRLDKSYKAYMPVLLWYTYITTFKSTRQYHVSYFPKFLVGNLLSKII